MKKIFFWVICLFAIAWNQNLLAGKRLKVGIVLVNQYLSTNTVCPMRAFISEKKLDKEWDISYVEFPADEIEAAKVAEKMMKHNPPDVVIGDYTSQHAFAIGRVFEQNKTPYLTTTCSLLAITEGRSFVARFDGSSKFYASRYSRFISEYLKVKSAAIIVDVSKPFSTEFAKFVKLGLEKYTPGIKIETYEIISADEKIKSIIRQVVEKKPGVIYAPLYAFEGTQVIQELDALKSNIPLFLHRSTLGSQVPGSSFFPIYFNGGANPSSNKEKLKEYSETIDRHCQGNKAMSTFDNLSASTAWDTIGLLAEITKSQPALRGKQLIEVFNSSRYRGIAGNRFLDKDGVVSVSTNFYEKKNGEKESKFILTYED